MLVHKTREIKSIKKTLNNSTMQSSNYNLTNIHVLYVCYITISNYIYNNDS